MKTKVFKTYKKAPETQFDIVQLLDLCLENHALINKNFSKINKRISK